MDSYSARKERIVKVLVETTGNSGLTTELPDSTDLLDDIGLDSIQMINFILLIEDEFGIEIDFEEFNIDYLKSIKILCEYIVTIQEKKNMEAESRRVGIR